MKPQQQVVHHRRKSCWFPTGLTLVLCLFSSLLCVSVEFLVQFEEDRWEPGRWQNLSTYSGDLNSVILQLVPFVNYQFRVIAINSVGQSQPSRPSYARYKTSGAGETHHTNSSEIICLRIDNDVLRLKLMLAHLLLYGWLNVVLTYFTWKIWMLIMCLCS